MLLPFVPVSVTVIEPDEPLVVTESCPLTTVEEVAPLTLLPNVIVVVEPLTPAVPMLIDLVFPLVVAPVPKLYVVDTELAEPMVNDELYGPIL
jgi:hypothetical protein